MTEAGSEVWQENQHFYISLAWLRTTFNAAARRNDYGGEGYQKMFEANWAIFQVRRAPYHLIRSQTVSIGISTLRQQLQRSDSLEA